MAEEGRPIVADGQATFDLGHIRDTVRAHRDRHLTLTLETGALFGVAATLVPPPPLRPRPGDLVRARVVGPGHGGLLIEGEGWEALVRCFQLIGKPEDYVTGSDIGGWVVRDSETLLVDARPFDPARFRLGTTVRGRVVNANDRGIVVDLGGCDGRIQANRLPADRPPESYRTGEEVEARVIDVQRHERWWKLAIAAFDTKGLQAGDTLSCRVTGSTGRAVFLDVRGLVGFVPEDEIGPNAPRTGDTVNAWVIRLDHHRESILCSLRPFDAGDLAVGRDVTAIVAAAAASHVTLDLPGGLRGNVSERGLPPHLVGSADRHLRAGQRIPVTVREINPRTRWIDCAYRPTEYSFGDYDEPVEASPFAQLKTSARERSVTSFRHRAVRVEQPSASPTREASVDARGSAPPLPGRPGPR